MLGRQAACGFWSYGPRHCGTADIQLDNHSHRCRVWCWHTLISREPWLAAVYCCMALDPLLLRASWPMLAPSFVECTAVLMGLLPWISGATATTAATFSMNDIQIGLDIAMWPVRWKKYDCDNLWLPDLSADPTCAKRMAGVFETSQFSASQDGPLGSLWRMHFGMLNATQRKTCFQQRQKSIRSAESCSQVGCRLPLAHG